MKDGLKGIARLRRRRNGADTDPPAETDQLTLGLEPREYLLSSAPSCPTRAPTCCSTPTRASAASCRSSWSATRRSPRSSGATCGSGGSRSARPHAGLRLRRRLPPARRERVRLRPSAAERRDLAGPAAGDGLRKRIVSSDIVEAARSSATRR